MISQLHLNNNSLLILSNRLPRWLSSKESACNAEGAGDSGLIPGSIRSPVGGHGNPLQFSCLENPMDRGAWWATACGVTKSRTRLSGWLSLWDCLCLSFACVGLQRLFCCLFFVSSLRFSSLSLPYLPVVTSTVCEISFIYDVSEYAVLYHFLGVCSTYMTFQVYF